MPRNSVDDGDDKIERRASTQFGGEPSEYEEEEDLELLELERRLNEEVDEEFFTEPKRFQTIHRVIDVLGLQMIDDATVQSSHQQLDKNPAYRNLKAQQQIVEGAIEHMAVIHCGDLNGSVIQVGKVARQFNDAVSRVRQLRKQVRDIQDTLGAANPNEAPREAARPQNASSMSLRELWLKKLECEAVLSLLEKLDVIRAAPGRFDTYVGQSPCRVGAAVVQVSTALQTMFSDDVAQVQALHKIMEQLMLRKQKAEEMVWEALADILYLRTGNGKVVSMSPSRGIRSPNYTRASGAMSVASGSSIPSGKSGSNSHTVAKTAATNALLASSTKLGFFQPFWRFSLDFLRQDLVEDDEDDDISVQSDTVFQEPTMDAWGTKHGTTGAVTSSSRVEMTINAISVVARGPNKFMIPSSFLEAELDLEADERRCLEDTIQVTPKPRYTESVPALRIMVECLCYLKRLDDTERVLLETMPQELVRIRKRQQAVTFSRLERKRMTVKTIRGSQATILMELEQVKQHLIRLLSAYGAVYLRLCHLAQIIRYRIKSDKGLLKSTQTPGAVLRQVIQLAYDIIQREVREFVKACLQETSSPSTMEAAGAGGAYESGLFSLGIAPNVNRNASQAVSTATRSNVMEMSNAKFVTGVLFAKTKSQPQIRHALVFRPALSRWTETMKEIQSQLAAVTGDDTAAPSYRAFNEEPSLQFLDRVIQAELLPVLQEEAVNGTVKGLERRDAFDPVLDRTLYSRPGANEPQDIEMCMACQAMYQYTGPLFEALHRLPKDGEMYLPLVAVLEHVVLTFISRVKQQVGNLCNGKTAWNVLMQDGGEGTPSLSSICERRRPFRLLLGAYDQGTHGLSLEEQAAGDGLLPLPPSPSDTARHLDTTDLNMVEDILEGVEGEEAALQFELPFLKQLLDFSVENKRIVVSSDEELMRAACLAHSLLKLASLLESRLLIRLAGNKAQALTSTRALREAIKTIKTHGIKMAKFCRIDMLMQGLSRMSRVCRSSTLVAQDAVRIPSSVNDLGDYITSASDNLREAAGNAVTAYTFSSLEQYLPLFLMQSVRVVAEGKGIITKAPLTLNGIEALDRSGSVLYRDLKGATSFENSFWDVELAASCFEQSAGFIAMLEFDMEELVAYFAANRSDFSDADFELMFSMNGPRRRGDLGRYHLAKRQFS